MLAMTVDFPGGNRARVGRVDIGGDAASIVKVLKLPKPRAVILLEGGAAGMSEEEIKRVRPLIAEGVARVAVEEGITVIDGGTQAGVMQMMGEGRSVRGGEAPLIGVCPAELVTWPEGPVGEELVPLEPNHSHFVLTDGDDWGAERETTFALAEFLSKDVPSRAVLANGGKSAKEEVLLNVRQGREVIVLVGSGRLADEIAASVRGEAQHADGKMGEIVRRGRILLFDISNGAEALANLIRRRLFEK
jgi:hypothetical protein